MDLKAYDTTIAAIYEAALDPGRWDVALTHVVGSGGPPHWDVAFLIWEQLQPPRGRFVATAGVNDFAREGYLTVFAGRNPWAQRVFTLPIGTVVHTDEIMDREEFRSSELYERFLKTWRIEAAIIGVIDSSGPERLGLVMPGPDTGDHMVLLEATRRIAPHLQRAVRISRRIGEADLRAENAEMVISRAPSAVFLIGEGMTLMHANPRAESMIADGYADVRHGHIRFLDKAADADLRGLCAAHDGAPSSAVTFEIDDKPVMRALAMRVTQPIAQTLTGPAYGARLLVVAGRDHGGVPQGAVQRYMDWFGFTQMEARLAVALAQGASLDSYANERSVTVDAARFLLKGLFAKTGVHKQPQLVALLRDAPQGWIEPNSEG